MATISGEMAPGAGYGHLFEGFEERLRHRLEDLYENSVGVQSGIGS